MLEIITRQEAISRGLNTYFSGEPCKNGHISERFVSCRKCKACNREAQSARLKKHPEFKKLTIARLKSIEGPRRKSSWERAKDKPEKRREAKRRSYKKNPFTQAVRGMVHRVLDGNKKTDQTEKILGYSAQNLKDRLSCQFKPGMSFDNFGEWHIDHKKPVSRFNHKNPSIVNMLCNLQPLWAKDNLSKGAR